MEKQGIQAGPLVFPGLIVDSHKYLKCSLIIYL